MNGPSPSLGLAKTSVDSATANIVEWIWQLKYRSQPGSKPDGSLEETFDRVARAASAVEPDREMWRRRFFDAFLSRKLLPAGRILAQAGREGRPLLNTYVIPPVSGSVDRILDCLVLSGGALAAGGGIGIDFSDVPPSADGTSVGALAMMQLWNSFAHAAFSKTDRRGAMMAVLDCRHPDILEFIASKEVTGALANFNISVLVSDEFMLAARADRDWQLQFRGQPAGAVRARQLWDALVRASHAGGEPGVIFIDRVRAANNLSYCEEISATNSCAEQPLPAFGSVPLASINLAELVRAPFSDGAGICGNEIAAPSGLAVRLLDNIVDLSSYPDPRQALESRNTRRIGIGVTGLGDALTLCGARYGQPRALDLISAWLGALRDGAYSASVELAAERRSFERLDRQRFLAAPFVRSLPLELRRAIERRGIRNAVLLSIAPAGSLSLLAGNVSSGIEPVFSQAQTRQITDARGERVQVRLASYSLTKFRRLFGPRAPLPDAAFVTSRDVSPREHIDVLATAQRFIDASISKTINFSESATIGDVAAAIEAAHSLGCKSVTVYRPNPIRAPILKEESTSVPDA